MSGKATIRPTEEGDLEGIAALFPEGRNLTLLRWLLSDPSKPESLRSWVAVDDGRIVGHCGYITSDFSCGSSTLIGSAQMDWVVRPEYQGTGVGGQLMRETFAKGDFAFVPGGSGPGRRGFVRLGYQRLFDITYFVKILDPVRYVTRGRGRIRRLAKAALLTGTSRREKPYEKDTPASVDELRREQYREGERPSGYTANVLAWPHLEWALRCPVVEAQALQVKVGDQPAGVALCYLNHAEPRTARLTHLSYLGEVAATWRSAVAAVEDVLRARGCTMVSALASHPAFMTALADRGFVARNGLPMWVRDPSNVVPRQGWHLTAIESDLGHRGV